MKVTLKEIAKKANVTQTTVSFVLNKDFKGKIRSDTRNRILKVAHKLGYSQNPFAQDLKRSEKMGVTLIAQCPFDQYTKSIIAPLENILLDTDYMLYLVPVFDQNITTKKLAKIEKTLYGYKSISRCFIILNPLMPKVDNLVKQITNEKKYPVLYVQNSAEQNQKTRNRIILNLPELMSTIIKDIQENKQFKDIFFIYNDNLYDNQIIELLKDNLDIKIPKYNEKQMQTALNRINKNIKSRKQTAVISINESSTLFLSALLSIPAQENLQIFELYHSDITKQLPIKVTGLTYNVEFITNSIIEFINSLKAKKEFVIMKIV